MEYHPKRHFIFNYVSCLPLLWNPSWEHTTAASGLPHWSSHTVPQASLKHISTRPSYWSLPPASLISPLVQMSPVELTNEKRNDVSYSAMVTRLMIIVFSCLGISHQHHLRGHSWMCQCHHAHSCPMRTQFQCIGHDLGTQFQSLGRTLHWKMAQHLNRKTRETERKKNEMERERQKERKRVNDVFIITGMWIFWLSKSHLNL